MADTPSDAGGPHLAAAPEPIVETPPAEPDVLPLEPRWWGAVTLPVDGVARWRAGPSTVVAERRRTDWRLWHTSGPDAHASVAERVRAIAGDAVPDGAPTLRYSFDAAPDSIDVRPRLADRPVVVRPESPLVVPPHETVTLYASTPVWMAISLEIDRPRRGRRADADDGLAVLTELPSSRPSDTWLGPNTREGELCYAVRTAARTEIDALPLRPHRAVTPLTIENRAASPLELQRVAVPMPYLALHVDRAGRLWSDGVRFVREPDEDTTIEPAPHTPDGGEKLAEPRTAPTLGEALSRTVSRLFKVDGR